MRVLIAGASGVIGSQLTPMLQEEGHDVVGLARAAFPSSARVVQADALDLDAVVGIVSETRPDVIVNMLTAIPGQLDPKRFAEQFELTNRLRIQGTSNLITAAAEVGVRQFLSQGLAFAYDPGGEGPASEDAPLWQNPPTPFAPALEALKQLEANTLAVGGTVLRLGHLYGPGTGFAIDGSVVRQVRDRQVPLVGGGAATFSFTHTRDAAAAVLSVIDTGHPGVFNVVDDEPAQMRHWLPYLARELDAPQPRRVPTFLARWAIGPWGVAFMTALRGAANDRARRILGWQPAFASWRTGFTAELRSTAR
ncbi:NAD-dependent epimerase/dehydratase family protein [Pseudactinotalea sp. Z1732]|uniref:NAD-dependent epimerase/dehydratase family protein n=1 Tax=Micrococcales TaxID=85006 RepID=UPI003C7D130C